MALHPGRRGHAVTLSAFLFVLLLSGCSVCGENFSGKYIKLSSFVCDSSGSNKFSLSRIEFRYFTHFEFIKLLFARSVRNETAEIFDHVCVSKADLLTITEHGQTPRDAAIRAGLCPTFLDMLTSLGLNQHDNQLTHCNGHILDLIVTRMSESLVTRTPLARRSFYI